MSKWTTVQQLGIGSPLWKPVCQYIIKSIIYIPYNPGILLLDVCMPNWNGDACSPKDIDSSVHSSIIHETSNIENTQVLTSSKIRKIL